MNLLTGVSETALMTLNGRADQATGRTPSSTTRWRSPTELLATEFGVDYSKFGRRGRDGTALAGRRPLHQGLLANPSEGHRRSTRRG